MCYIPTLALCFTKHQYTSGKKYYLCSGTKAQWQPFWNLAAIVFNIISHNTFLGIISTPATAVATLEKLRQPFTVSENLPEDQVRILYPLFCIGISSNSWVGRCVWSHLISICFSFAPFLINCLQHIPHLLWSCSFPRPSISIARLPTYSFSFSH